MADAPVTVQDTGDNVAAPPPEVDTSVAEQTSVDNNQSDGSVDWAKEQDKKEPAFLDMSDNDPLAQATQLGGIKPEAKAPNQAQNEAAAGSTDVKKPVATMKDSVGSKTSLLGGTGSPTGSNSNMPMTSIEGAAQRAKVRR